MNYLAHLFLAGDNAELITGNFIADEVKGMGYEDYPEKVAEGIIMHRETDYYCDNHPIYLKSKHRLSPAYGKYSGIITDMFYDYFLANEWNRYSTLTLREFCNNTYHTLTTKEAVMHPHSKKLLAYMIQHDWLVSYKEPDGIKQALKGISKRLKYYFPLEDAVSEMIENKELYRNEFLEFFPLLREHLSDFKH